MLTCRSWLASVASYWPYITIQNHGQPTMSVLLVATSNAVLTEHFPIFLYIKETNTDLTASFYLRLHNSQAPASYCQLIKLAVGCWLTYLARNDLLLLAGQLIRHGSIMQLCETTINLASVFPRTNNGRDMDISFKRQGKAFHLLYIWKLARWLTMLTTTG